MWLGHHSAQSLRSVLNMKSLTWNNKETRKPWIATNQVWLGHHGPQSLRAVLNMKSLTWNNWKWWGDHSRLTFALGRSHAGWHVILQEIQGLCPGQGVCSEQGLSRGQGSFSGQGLCLGQGLCSGQGLCLGQGLCSGQGWHIDQGLSSQQQQKLFQALTVFTVMNHLFPRVETLTNFLSHVHVYCTS